MTRPNDARATRSAAGTCRNRRRAKGPRRAAWVRPFRRVRRALAVSLRLMESTLRTVIDAERCAHRRPVGASRQLHEASGELIRAIQRLLRAARDLAAINECLARDPENGGVPPGLVQATAYCAYAQALLARTADEVFGLHREVLDGLETGTLVPEREPGRRPRIVLAPRSAPLRAFLRLRQPRVIERIGPLLQRRRRTPRPRALRVPRRSALGRAPPRFSVCSL